jgi:hypothetical protein
MILTKIKGGLGNQIFQYFAGIYLAEKNKTTPSFYLEKGPKGAFQHGSSLLDLDFGSEFNQTIDISETDLNSRVSRFLSLHYPRIYLQTSKLWRSYVSSQTGFDPHLEMLKGEISLEGYFQSYKYFESLKAKGITKGKFHPTNPSTTLSKMQERLVVENPIVMHLRRGDYVTNLNTGLLSGDYYINALKTLAFENRSVWVFSDDIQLAKAQFTHQESSTWTWIGSGQIHLASENLYLMSLSRDIIIGNSTFSFWAANLNERKNVIAPKKWFERQNDPQDLYPPGWITIDSSWIR